MNNPRISIICVTFNSAADLPDFLQSVEKLPPEWAEVIFIDNASSDKTSELIEIWGKAGQFVRNEENRGWSAANNQGVTISTGKLLFFANPDVWFEVAALQKLVWFLDGHSEFDAAAPQLLNRNGAVQPSCRRLPTVADLFFQISGLAFLFPCSFLNRWKMPDFEHKDFREVQQPMASALLIRRETFEKVGGIDEQFFVFFGDVDFAHRLKEAKRRTAFYPEARMFHQQGSSTRKMGAAFYFSSHFGFFRYLWKWGRLSQRAILLFLWLPLFLTAVGRVLFYFVFAR